MTKRYIATITRGNQSVQVKSVEGLIGYEFSAEGKESLPLAAELAVLQTQKGIGAIDALMPRRIVVAQVGR